MITYSKERYLLLCREYLRHIEETYPAPAEHIASEMRRYAPVSPDTVLYIKLMLLNENDRALLGEMLVRIHYAKERRNILVETDKGLEGEDADCVARRLDATIREKADVFSMALHRKMKDENDTLAKRVQKCQQEASRIKKEIKKINGDILQMSDQIAKKRRQIDNRMERLQECLEDLRQMGYDTAGPLPKEETKSDDDSVRTEPQPEQEQTLPFCPEENTLFGRIRKLFLGNKRT